MNAKDALERVRSKGIDALEVLVRTKEAFVHELAGPDALFEDIEVLTMAASSEIDRLLLEAKLKELSAEFGDAVSIDGKEYVAHEPGTVTYHSLCGPLGVPRSTYRQTGVHNGPTVVPLELVAGLMERATPALAKAAALGYAKHEMRGVVEDLENAHRLPPSRATMERIARRVAEEAHAEAPRIEKVLRRSETVPENAHGIVLGLDRGSVPMAEERPAEQAPATRRRKRIEPYVRTPPTPFDVMWRMAPVATVTVTDANGDALETRKYAAAPADGWSEIVARAIADISAALRQRPQLRVAVVQDGAHELWNVTREALKKVPRVSSYLEAVDRYHLTERLGKVLQIIEPEAAARRRAHDRWQAMLDTDPTAIDEIERTVLRAHQRLGAQDAAALWEHIVYLRNNKDRMRYAELRVQGLPVGSGATESGCNTLLNLRVKRNAEHWSIAGLRSVLTLRGLHQSGRFHPFWKLLARRYRCHVIPESRSA